MLPRISLRGGRRAALSALALLVLTAACAPSGSPVATAPATAGPTPGGAAGEAPTAVLTAVVGASPSNLPSLPEAFRYELRIRPADAPNAAEIVTTGQYRSGAWEQSVRSSAGQISAGQADEEMVSVDGQTYTRAVGENAWTRWPGMGFDALYGLAAPFSPLRLYSVVADHERGDLAAVPGATEPTFRRQMEIPAAAIEQVVNNGAANLAKDEEERAALVALARPYILPQTITYWVGESGQVFRAAATLLAETSGGKVTPWMQVIWRFWDYGDPGITVTAPGNFVAATGTEASAPPAAATAEAGAATTQNNLVVEVFASPGIPAEDLVVSVYPAGETSRPLDWRHQPEAAFSLPSGTYDILVLANYAEEWRRSVRVGIGGITREQVVFDFGTLELTVHVDGQVVPVEIATYPEGQRDNWVDWRSDNPATIQLREGTYEVEIAYADFTRKETVSGLSVRTGQTTSQTIDLER